MAREIRIRFEDEDYESISILCKLRAFTWEDLIIDWCYSEVEKKNPRLNDLDNGTLNTIELPKYASEAIQN